MFADLETKFYGFSFSIAAAGSFVFRFEDCAEILDERKIHTADGISKLRPKKLKIHSKAIFIKKPRLKKIVVGISFGIYL